jgi:hypothetical protein
MTSIRPVDRRAVEDRGPKDDIASRLESEASSHRGVGKDRGSSLTALGKFGTDAKRTVDEESGGLDPVELAVQVVASDEGRDSISEQVLLKPGFVELPAGWRLEIADSLGVSDEIARVTPVGPETIEEERQTLAAEQALRIDRELEVEIADISSSASGSAA